ncbi:MPT63 family protein [Mycobacterium ostraviense]|uniref:DUF1942 domain-containing protein n=1 Tax=Mycobacterium ostraviense TaxID=2738409 RepID=UPI0015D46E09|nr:DUF1942 domain-containing protein [Mycobacterium ostraviense]UGT90149.1 MPT63 family protein [Mycobacterium ostraviense]
MTLLRSIKTAVAGAALVLAAVFTATTALAGPPAPFGASQQVTGNWGNEVYDVTVSNLAPTGDGHWYADVTMHAIKGNPSPHIGAFTAIAADGTRYNAVLGNNPDGLPTGPLPQGQTRSGKIYFGVLGGPAPDSISFTPVATNDYLLWKG